MQISCDFCPSLFHLDCLDPPLTSVPSNGLRWMCPLHPDPVLEERVLDHGSAPDCQPLLSQRVRLYNLFSGKKVNQKTVQLSFMQKAKDEAARLKDQVFVVPHEKRVQVPNAVKQM